MKRCPWADSSPKMQKYHDEVWGRPVYDDQQLFRKLMLDINQAGLSWETILNKSDHFDCAYEQFEIAKVASFNEEKIAALLQDAGIVRNRLKVRAAVNNAQKVLEIQKEFGSFSQYLWGFTDQKPIQHHFTALEEVPATSTLSDQITKDLKKRGFKFVGSTIIYAFLQAVGIVNDHLTTCWCYQKSADSN